MVLDLVGSDDSFKLVKFGGCVLFVGFASGKIPKVAANIALVKNLTLHGLYWGDDPSRAWISNSPVSAYERLSQLFGFAGKTKLYAPELFRQSLEEPVQWLAQGKLQVHVSHRYLPMKVKIGLFTEKYLWTEVLLGAGSHWSKQRRH